MSISKRAIRLISALMTLAVMMTALAGLSVTASAASKWDGYTKISSATDLLKMKNSDGKFYLTKDIDMKSYGKWDEAIRFSGTLDGNGFSVKNLTSEQFGLFYSLTDATVRNLGITNVKIDTKKSVGALTNGCKNSAIENCYVTGSIKSQGHAGGLVGYDTGTTKGNNTLTNCVNMASVESTKYGAYGIIVSEHTDTLKNCVNYGNITAKTTTAGICNRAGVELISCYNLGKIAESEKGWGGIACYVMGKLENCATSTSKFTHSMPANCTETADVNVSKSTFKKADTYVGFDFGKTWTISSKINSGHPVLTIMLKDYNGSRPTASNPAGSYKNSVKVELTTNLENGVIRYTTNGKTPTASSAKYTKPLTITKDTTVKAAVFVNGVRAKVITLKYTIKK